MALGLFSRCKLCHFVAETKTLETYFLVFLTDLFNRSLFGENDVKLRDAILNRLEAQTKQNWTLVQGRSWFLLRSRSKQEKTNQASGDTIEGRPSELFEIDLRQMDVLFEFDFGRSIDKQTPFLDFWIAVKGEIVKKSPCFKRTENTKQKRKNLEEWRRAKQPILLCIGQDVKNVKERKLNDAANGLFRHDLVWNNNKGDVQSQRKGF